MVRIRNLKLFMIAFAASVLLVGCPEKGCEDGVPGMLVDYSGLSGCTWIIQLQNGERLEPLNLDKFDIVPVDSLIVHVTYAEAPTMMSICMVGKMVEITCISKLSNKYKGQFLNAVSENKHTPQNDATSRVIAFPGVISYRLPDDYMLDIYLKGDEYNHTVTTEDGYLLVMNNDGFYEYAVKKEGRLQPSGFIARNKMDRDEEVQNFLEKINQ